jgi:hypothetical protein
MENLDHIYESWEIIFLVKILKFFDMHPGSRIWDGKNSNLGSGIQDGKNLDPGSGSGMGNMRIRDKHPRSAKLEILLPNLLGLKEPKNNQTLCGKAFRDETKSFLQSKVTSVTSERGKTPVNWIFQSPTRHGCCHWTTSPGAKPLLQLTFIRP